MIDDLNPICRCLCKRATIVVDPRNEPYTGYMHLPDNYLETMVMHGVESYCFWWSTFALLRRVRFFIAVFVFEHFTRPVLRLVKHKEFKYVCAYCGRKTRQMPLTGHSKSFCSDLRCIEKYAEDDEENERQEGESE